MTPIPTDVSQTANWQSSIGLLQQRPAAGHLHQQPGRQPAAADHSSDPAERLRRDHRGGGPQFLPRRRHLGHRASPGPPTTDLFGSGKLQGGSTITVQYAKNYYSGVGAARSITTKLKEIFMAIKLAHARSKPWIMTNYLNTVPFGSTSYGIWAAAQDYFGINLAKPGTTLTIAQAAMLGAMPNNPAFFTPDPTAGTGYTMLVHALAVRAHQHGARRRHHPADSHSALRACALPDAEKVFNKTIQLGRALQATAGPAPPAT